MFIDFVNGVCLSKVTNWSRKIDLQEVLFESRTAFKIFSSEIFSAFNECACAWSMVAMSFSTFECLGFERD